MRERRVSPTRARAQDPAPLASGSPSKEGGCDGHPCGGAQRRARLCGSDPAAGTRMAPSLSLSSLSSSQETNQLWGRAQWVLPTAIPASESSPSSPPPPLSSSPGVLPPSPDSPAGLWVGSPRWMKPGMRGQVPTRDCVSSPWGSQGGILQPPGPHFSFRHLDGSSLP